MKVGALCIKKEMCILTHLLALGIFFKELIFKYLENKKQYSIFAASETADKRMPDTDNKRSYKSLLIRYGTIFTGLQELINQRYRPLW